LGGVLGDLVDGAVVGGGLLYLRLKK